MSACVCHVCVCVCARAGGMHSRHVPGVFTVLQRCIELTSIATDTTTLRHTIMLCLRGCGAAPAGTTARTKAATTAPEDAPSAATLAPDPHMREAAVAALGGVAAALCVPDPLLAERAPAGADTAAQSAPLVMTPAVRTLMGVKGAITIALNEAKYDRVVSVRKAAVLATQQVARVPWPSSGTCSA